jgi:hypothetical protein
MQSESKVGIVIFLADCFVDCYLSCFVFSCFVSHATISHYLFISISSPYLSVITYYIGFRLLDSKNKLTVSAKSIQLPLINPSFPTQVLSCSSFLLLEPSTPRGVLEM